MDALDRLLDALTGEIDPAHLLKGIGELSTLERPTDFDSFTAAAQYTRDRYRAAGLVETAAGTGGIRQFPADGKMHFHTYEAPIGFRTRRAVCSQIGDDGKETVLGDRAVEPNTAIVGTGHTGPAGITANALLVRSRKDITATSARGKIVFTPNLHPQTIRAAALKAGALAVVSSQMERDAHAYVRWHNTWDVQPDGWLPTAAAAAENFPGLALAPDVGEKLAAALATGPVRLKVVTEGEYFEGRFPAVDLRSPGTFEQELILSGHLFEQGAMDNASGVITALLGAELLPRALQKTGRPQTRAIRAFHSQECYGVLALHAADPGSLVNSVAHLNVDQVGATDVPLKVGRGLDASAGATNWVFEQLCRRVSTRLNQPCDWWDEFTINCTILADPALGGVPTSFIDQPHHSWHTSRDRFGVFEFSPAILTQAALITSAWTAFFATAGSAEARAVADGIVADTAAKLKAGVQDSALLLELAMREVASAARLAAPGDRAAIAATAVTALEKLEPGTGGTRIDPAGTPAVIAEAKALYPTAVIGGPLVAKYFPPAVVKQLGLEKWNSTQYKLKCWATGAWSIHDILRRTLYEERPGTEEKLTLAYTVNYFKALANAGLVKLNERPVAGAIER
ncbi:MAG TPA: M28 family peptidase [Planctomycetota bacterium]|nr:M28 family peptidase [Planctomycetota bacterium]